MNLKFVRLAKPFKTVSGSIIPGTILQVFADGSAYQIEFEGPYDVPETLPANFVEANDTA